MILVALVTAASSLDNCPEWLSTHSIQAVHVRLLDIAVTALRQCPSVEHAALTKYQLDLESIRTLVHRMALTKAVQGGKA